MGIITKMRKQDAVYWARDGADGYGQPQYAPPAAVRCRWDDTAEQLIDPTTGAVFVSQSRVYVDRDMQPGDWLWLGLLADVPVATDPVASGGYEVKRFDKIPNLKASEFLRIAIL
jgi:hypothetical protein